MEPMQHRIQASHGSWIWGCPSLLHSLFAHEAKVCLLSKSWQSENDEKFISAPFPDDKQVVHGIHSHSSLFICPDNSLQLCVAGSPEGIHDLSQAVPSCHQCLCPSFIFLSAASFRCFLSPSFLVSLCASLFLLQITSIFQQYHFTNCYFISPCPSFLSFITFTLEFICVFPL